MNPPKEASECGEADFPELAALEGVIESGRGWLESRVLCEVAVPRGASYPLYALSLGNPDPALPIVGYFGGVHGLERIGSQVVISFLQGLVSRLAWDRTLHEQLANVRMLFVPIVNPGGMRMARRSNPQGVDLMRNAPVEATQNVPPLLGGHRLSPHLPWYRGALGQTMQPESQALCDLVQQEMLHRPFALAIDCHSGFGSTDRVWFPYAHTKNPFPHAPEMHALKAIFESANLHSRYIFEPQSLQYLTHGDLWDHLYLESQAVGTCNFLPLTLEMGSWLWVKKNPRQLFSMAGMFNPLIEHRQRRVLRQHQMLLDFMSRAANGYAGWMPAGDARAKHFDAAIKAWF